MGVCQSLYYEDEDERKSRVRNKQMQKEYEEFQKQLRKQRQIFSELDLKTGKGRTKKDPSPEEVRIATNIIYDA